MLVLLVSFGSINFVLLKVLFSSFGESSAFFVSQGINLLYVVYGGLVVYPRLLPWGVGDWLSVRMGFEPITPAMVRSPQRRFAAMGLLDCFGTFFTAMGAVYTPGQYQPLLNQSLVPCTMLVSALVLRKRYSLLHTLGALLIVSGAVVSLAPTLAGGDDKASHPKMRLYAVGIYWLSNVPMACSAVYKESRFHNEHMDVCWLTQWVSVYQLLFGFVLAPLQLIPGVGTAHGMSLGAIVRAFEGGWACLAESEGSGCAGLHTAAQLFGYVGINFLFNTTGLWLTKHGGAVLNSMAYALLVPLTTVFFSFGCMGQFRENLHAATFLGLAVVLVGFGVWRYSEIRAELAAAEGSAAALRETLVADAADAVPAVQDSFQERIIGMGTTAHRPPKHAAEGGGGAGGGAGGGSYYPPGQC